MCNRRQNIRSLYLVELHLINDDAGTLNQSMLLSVVFDLQQILHVKSPVEKNIKR
jgi:hypothetical protein